MQRRHGEKGDGEVGYFVEGRGFLPAGAPDTYTPGDLLESDRTFMDGASVAEASIDRAADALPPGAVQRHYRFGLMFQDPPLVPFRPAREALVELGNAMENALDAQNQGDGRSNPENLPAGYTFLAQLVAHDMSFDETKGVPEGLLTPDQITSGRSPALDLDNLYGMGPLSDKELYDDEDLIRLKVGATTPTRLGSASSVFFNDLPRDIGNPASPLRALIGDPRDDDNLAVAQTHVAFSKFHNKVVDDLARKGGAGSVLFEEARRTVTLHYQWIILHDLLPRLIEEQSLVDRVVKKGATYFKLKPGDAAFMPVEFAFAAYRLGHSMVRDRYEWNRVFQSSNKTITTDAARLFELFSFTGLNGNMRNSQTLPSNWIIDWTRFYDFAGFNGLKAKATLNLSRPINTSLTAALKNVPGFLAQFPSEYRSLAVLDLIRGAIVGLPTGQDVATRIGVAPLEPADVEKGPHKEILNRYGFHKKTPLWYYVLKEAEVLHDGKRLGPVGSLIVTETLVELVRASRISILDGTNWEPDLGSVKPRDFGMADLLFYVKDNINPLGD